MTHPHRSRPRNRGPAVVLAGLALTSACGSSDPAPDPGAAPLTTSATPSASTTPEASASESATPEVEPTPIDGTWTTPTLAPGDFRRALTRQGFGEHTDDFIADLGRKVDLTLEIGGGFWTLSGSIDGRPLSVVDRGSVEVQGDRVLVRPNSGGENLFRWRVEGDELALELMSTTEPPYEGVPAATFQGGLYTTSVFTKEAS